MHRSVDVIAALIVLVVLSPLLLGLVLLIKLTSPGPVLYWSSRVGINNTLFRMPKFRTMRVDTPVVATHLLSSPEQYLTSIAPVLRRFSLDELPQLFSVLKGDLTLVGPRPALHNQHDLIALRTASGVHKLVPGLTGWAQVNGRDELSIPRKVELDAHYLAHRSMLFDAKILFRTVVAVVRGSGVSH